MAQLYMHLLLTQVLFYRNSFRKWDFLIFNFCLKGIEVSEFLIHYIMWSLNLVNASNYGFKLETSKILANWHSRTENTWIHFQMWLEESWKVRQCQSVHSFIANKGPDNVLRPCGWEDMYIYSCLVNKGNDTIHGEYDAVRRKAIFL